MAVDDISLSLAVDGHALTCQHVTLELAVSAPLSCRVDAAVPSGVPGPKAKDLLGKKFVLTISPRRREALVVHGVVTGARRSAGVLGGRYRLTLGSEVCAPLSIGQDSRVFQQMTVVDVVKDVLSRGGVADGVTWSTSATYPKRVYVAQYGESDWAFIERMCAEEGIHYFFDLEADATKLVFADDSTKAKAIEGDPKLPVKDETGLESASDAVFRVRRRGHISSGKVSHDDYDPAHPPLTLDASASSGSGSNSDASLELYDFPGRYGDPGRGGSLAKTSLEARRAGVLVTSGHISGTRLRPGLSFEIQGHEVEGLDGKLVCTSLHLETWEAVGLATSASSGFHAEWTAIPQPTPFRPPARHASRAVTGPQSAVVCGPPGQDTHTNDIGQIRAQFFWDRVGKRDDAASTWMRVGQFALGGSMIIPRCGWEIVAEHHNGDADRPFIVQHLYDGKFTVPYALPANMTRTSWQTLTTPGGGSTNEIRYEDKAGSEEVFVNASKDMAEVVGDSSQVKIGANHTHSIGVNHDVKIGAKHIHGVKGDHKVSVGAMESHTVGGNRSIAISGSDSQTVGAARMATLTGGKGLDADGGRSLTVGGVMMDVTPMTSGRTVVGSTSVTVGGAHVSAAASGLGAATGGAAAETIGGAKLQIGAKGVSMGVKGSLAETVGGAFIASAGGDAGDSAGSTLTLDVGGAALVNSPDVLFEATDQITLVVGGTSMTITTSSIEIKAPALASPGATVGKDGSAVHHNP